jgi:hypothetical protein
MTGTNIYIYTRTYVYDGMEMRRNLFMDLLVREKMDIRVFSANIKYYLSRITEKIYKVKFMSLRRGALHDLC